MRSPSGWHQSGMRGREPVAISDGVGRRARSVPSTVVDLDLVRARRSAAVPLIMPHALALEQR